MPIAKANRISDFRKADSIRLNIVCTGFKRLNSVRIAPEQRPTVQQTPDRHSLIDCGLKLIDDNRISVISSPPRLNIDQAKQKNCRHLESKFWLIGLAFVSISLPPVERLFNRSCCGLKSLLIRVSYPCNLTSCTLANVQCIKNRLTNSDHPL